MTRALFHADARLIGVVAYAMPPLVIVGFVLLGLVVGDVPRMLVGGLEAGVPLAAALAVSSIVASEPALELQLSGPRGFRPAALRRIAALTAWCAAVSAVAWTLALVTGLADAWRPAVDPLTSQLTWASSLAVFVGAGMLLPLALGSRSTAAGTLGLAWILAFTFHVPWIEAAGWRLGFPFFTVFAPAVPDWLPNRLALLGIGAAAVALATVFLGAGERLLRAEEAA